MQCTEFDLNASQWMEGERTPQAAEHFQACAQCAGRLADLQLIASVAATLPELDPPASVWSSLRVRLDQEGLLRPRKSPWDRLREFVPRTPRTALATAALSAVAVLLLFLPESPMPGIATRSGGSSSAWNYARVNAQLASVEEQENRDVHLRDPQVSASYQQNLALVDNFI